MRTNAVCGCFMENEITDFFDHEQYGEWSVYREGKWVAVSGMHRFAAD